MKQLLFFSIALYLFALGVAGCGESDTVAQNYPSVSKDAQNLNIPLLKESDLN